MIDVHRALALSPHTDDTELGCGGTLARLIEQDIEVYVIAFSICEASVPNGFPEDILATEVKKSCQVLGVDLAHLMVYRYPVRYFPNHRQEILEDLIRVRREINPDLVFLPSANDVHQDHQVIYQEGVRAFRKKKVLGYELPWNNVTFTASAFVHLEKRHIAKKTSALQQYVSQQHRDYCDAEFIEGLARVRGTQAGADYAEAFQVVRWTIT